MSDEGGGGGHGGVWLVSYADMVTLIMAFFVVMYTMSQVDAAKMKKLVESMHTAFSPSFGDKKGVLNSRLTPGSSGMINGGSVAPRTSPMINPSAKRADAKGASRAEKDLAAVVGDIQKIARDMHVEKQIKTRITPRGAVITLEETAASSGGLTPFQSGSAQLDRQFMQFLDKLAPALHDVTTKIEVQGHTDRRPIRSAAYPSNWELSAARAGSVVRYLQQRHGLSPRRFVCAGFADTLPVADENTPAGWARNRRIEIVVTKQPIDAYDQMSRADAVSKPRDLTDPLGRRLVPTGLPQPVPETGQVEPAPAAGETGEAAAHH